MLHISNHPGRTVVLNALYENTEGHLPAMFKMDIMLGKHKHSFWQLVFLSILRVEFGNDDVAGERACDNADFQQCKFDVKVT